ncbi:MAG TPA: hypothetical protein VN740_01260 [Solirubrobacteraceae bacterium]|nr:hypothetical protein [Solirubrobacteraceae bacterium]
MAAPVSAQSPAISSFAARAAAGPQTIYDPTLRVTWLADADLAASEKFGLSTAQHGLTAINADGSMQYATAQAWVRRLNHANNGKGWLGHTNWTLPITPTPYSDTGCSGYDKKGGGNFGLGCTAAPLAELYADVLGVPSPDTAVAVPDTTTGPFRDFQPYLYWTGAGAVAGGFRTLSFNTGWAMGSNQGDHWMYVLPVLSGNPFGGTVKSGLQPVDGGQAVFEPGAGPHGADVTWLADADYAKTHKFSYGADINPDGAMEEPTAAKDWVPALNSNGVLGRHQGWSLPTPHALAALYKALEKAGYLSPQEPVVPVPNTTLRGFQDIQPYLYWSCAGESVAGPCKGVPNPNNQQWSFSFGNGFLGTDLTQNSLYVMVYYPGPTPLPPLPKPKPPSGHCSPPAHGQPVTCQ